MTGSSRAAQLGLSSSQARNRPSVRSTAIGRPKARLRSRPSQGCADRPGRDRPPRAEDERMPEPARDLLDVVRDEDDASWASRGRRAVRGRGRASRARPGRGSAPGSSRISRSGSGISARAISTRRCSPVDSVPNGAIARAPPAPISSRSHRARDRGPSSVNVCHHGPSAACRAVTTTSSAVSCGSIAASRPGAGVADAPPELARVDPADRLAEHLDRTGRRPEVRARDLDERRLARAVRPDDDPALAVADLPVDRSEDRPAGAPHRDAGQSQDHDRRS